MTWVRIYTDAEGASLHILRDGAAAEVHRLSMGDLVRLSSDSAAAVRDEWARRSRRPIQPVASERAGAHYVGRLGE